MKNFNYLLDPNLSKYLEVKESEIFQNKNFLRLFYSYLFGEEEKKQNYEEYLNEFLCYAHEKQFDMSWSLNLQFLSWFHTRYSRQFTLDLVNYSILRAILRWSHLLHEDIDYSGIIVCQNLTGDNNDVYVGLKSQSVLGKPKIFRAKQEIRKQFQKCIFFSKFSSDINNLSKQDLTWHSISI